MMKTLNKNELYQIKGGAAVSSTTAINAVIKAITALFNVGQAVGSAIRRATSNNYCSI